MKKTSPKIILNYKKDVDDDWGKKLFFGSQHLRDAFISWLSQKKLGQSDTEREEFLWAVQHTMVAEPHWISEVQEDTQSNIIEAKKRFATLHDLSIKMEKCLSGIGRIPGAPLALKMALRKEDRGSNGRSRDTAASLLHQALKYSKVLAAASSLAKNDIMVKPGQATFFDYRVKFIGDIWERHFKLKPSPSEKSKFNQFIQFLNKKIGTNLPTSSASLRRALKQ